MKKELITREEAAEICGVTIQSISNWADQGLIRIFRPNKITVRIYKDSLMEFIEKYSSEVINLDEKISSMKKEKESITEELKEEIKDQKEKLELEKISGNVRYELLRDDRLWYLLESLTSVLSDKTLERRERGILKTFISKPGVSLKMMGDELGITRERTRHLLERSIVRIEDRSESYKKLLEDKEKLQKEIEDLKAQNKIYQERFTPLKEELEKLKTVNIEDQEKLRIQTEKIKLINCELSVRILNCLKPLNISTLYDLLHFTENDLGKLRLFGKKGLMEIKEFIESYNKLNGTSLVLGMF